MTEKKVMKLASRGKRFGAFLIDEVVPMICLMILWGGFIAQLTSLIGGGYYNSYDSYSSYDSYDSSGTVMGTGLILVAVLLLLAYLGVQLYFFSRSQSIGKALLGMRVVSSETGKPVGFGKMFLREFIVKQASVVPFYLGYIWIMIDDRNRGWHDKILDTYVVDEKETKQMEGRPAANTYTDPGSNVAVKASDDPFDNPVSYTITAAQLNAQKEAAQAVASVENTAPQTPEVTEEAPVVAEATEPAAAPEDSTEA